MLDKVPTTNIFELIQEFKGWNPQKNTEYGGLIEDIRDRALKNKHSKHDLNVQYQLNPKSSFCIHEQYKLLIKVSKDHNE